MLIGSYFQNLLNDILIIICNK